MEEKNDSSIEKKTTQSEKEKTVENNDKAQKTSKIASFFAKMKAKFLVLAKKRYFPVVAIVLVLAIVSGIVGLSLLGKNNKSDDEVYYTIEYNTLGGAEIKSKTVLENSLIGKQKDAYKSGNIFIGWYYDEKFEEIVKEDDRVTKDICLYASYSSLDMAGVESVNYATQVDAEKSFSIGIESTEEMTADDVLALITAKNLNQPDNIEVVEVSGEKKSFSIFGYGGEFIEGCSYKINLNDEKLKFKDYPQTAREFDFSVKKQEVINVKLSTEMKYIDISQLSEIIANDSEVTTLSTALYQVNLNGEVENAELVKGSFKYLGSDIAVGDKVAIYCIIIKNVQKRCEHAKILQKT